MTPQRRRCTTTWRRLETFTRFTEVVRQESNYTCCYREHLHVLWHICCESSAFLNDILWEWGAGKSHLCNSNLLTFVARHHIPNMHMYDHFAGCNQNGSKEWTSLARPTSENSIWGNKMQMGVWFTHESPWLVATCKVWSVQEQEVLENIMPENMYVGGRIKVTVVPPNLSRG